MTPSIDNNHKPLSKHMIKTLKECHEREVLNLEPCDALTTRSASALVSRGLLATRKYVPASGKKYLALYLTDLGRAYINQLLF